MNEEMRQRGRRRKMRKTSRRGNRRMQAREWKWRVKHQYPQPGSNNNLPLHSYLNSQHIQKQKFTDADLTYGSMQMDVSEQLLEIGKP